MNEKQTKEWNELELLKFKVEISEKLLNLKNEVNG